jgi:hypothetical protein
MGRPKLLPEQKRSERLWCLVTPTERKQIEEHAKRKSREVPEHIRDILKRAARGDFGHGA